MTFAVALLGRLVAGIGFLGIAQPTRLIGWVHSFWQKDRLWVAVIMRFALGAVLIYAAPECRFPQAVRVLGVITVLAAVGIAVVGSERMDGFIRWWTERPLSIVRA